MADIILTVGEEFGAIGVGYGPSDAEVNALSEHYSEAERQQYWVALLDDEVVGGIGIAPLNGHQNVAEMRKLFLSKKSRGLGLGRKLSLLSLEFAKEQGFSQCYLDTLSSMGAAIALYESIGFKRLPKPLPGTIHTACDVWMLKTL